MVQSLPIFKVKAGHRWAKGGLMKLSLELIMSIKASIRKGA